jgi:hypothetical protein
LFGFPFHGLFLFHSHDKIPAGGSMRRRGVGPIDLMVTLLVALLLFPGSWNKPR